MTVEEADPPKEILEALREMTEHGYLIGPEHVIEAAKKVHDFLTVGAAAPLQEAAVILFSWIFRNFLRSRSLPAGQIWNSVNG